MVFQVKPVVMPSDLTGVTNGNLPPNLLWPVGPRGQMHHLAALSFIAMQHAARLAGFQITYTFGGTFRTYSDQYILWFQRMTTIPTVWGTTADGNPIYKTKMWLGQTWYLKKGLAECARPGTSNHGWGLAIDVANDYDWTDGANPEDATSIQPELPWLIEHAWEYGFSWELQSEPWHLRYCTGDVLPWRVWQFWNVPKVEDSYMAVHLVSATKGEWIWHGSKPLPFKTAADRDAIVAALDNPKVANISDAQLDALWWQDEAPRLPRSDI